ncbi:MAG: ion channel [Erythrobacter sp.]
MPVIKNVWQRVYIAVATLSWFVLIAAFIVHALISYGVFVHAGEEGLTDSFLTFAYYYVTTATTVGYGDLSPSSGEGRLIALLFVLPGSIALFTAFLGKAVADIGGFWRRRLNGLGDYRLRANHTIIVGWQGGRSRHLLTMMMDDCPDAERMVLIAPDLEENPLPEQLDFVRAESLSSVATYERAGSAGARAVVVRGDSDDDTLAATLAAKAAAPNAHVVAYFDDERSAELITRHDSSVEAISSIAIELMVRASRDPGASRLANLMFSSQTQDTAFSMQIPDDAPTLPYMTLLQGLKRSHDLMLLGVCDTKTGDVDLNCDLETLLAGGQTIFYLADKRADPADINWGAFEGVVAA